ncbi:MAG: ferredoxin:thioredoxin reductase [Candidatus Altiarchaeota archaeon]|nr:ferredoxin:thioredoxin reductase [Candidatus Altiarchaeota archaeon]
MATLYAKAKGFVLNPDEGELTSVIVGLSENEKKHKFRFCPCRPITGKFEEDKVKICPCKWHLDEIKEDGHCLCRLFFDPKRI